MAVFPRTSRYHECAIVEAIGAGGRVVQYVRRRLVPSQDSFSIVDEHVVRSGERLDMIAARYLGEPEQFWQICDANGVMNPLEVTAAIGEAMRLVIPGPRGA